MLIKKLIARTVPARGSREYFDRQTTHLLVKSEDMRLAGDYRFERASVEIGKEGGLFSSTPIFGGYLILDGRYESVRLTDAYDDLSKIHQRTRGVDFISDPVKIIQAADRSFPNPMKVKQVGVDDNFFDRHIALEMDVEKRMIYRVVIRVVDRFSGHELKDIQEQAYNQDAPNTVRFPELEGTHEALSGTALEIDTKRIEIFGERVPFRDIIKSGRGLISWNEVERYFENFMKWHMGKGESGNSRNTARRWVAQSYGLQRKLVELGSLEIVEELVSKSRAGLAEHPLAPTVIIEARVFEKEDPLRRGDNQIIVPYDVLYTGAFDQRDAFKEKRFDFADWKKE